MKRNKPQPRRIHPRIAAELARTGQQLVGYDRYGNALYQPTGMVGVSQPGQPGAAPSPFCAPQATILQSHGAGCPPGDCTDLAAALGRQWSDAGRCRELTYWFTVDVDAGGDAGVSAQNAVVTMCPTRLIIIEETPLAGATISGLTFNNQNQMIGDPLPLAAFAPDAVQAVPYVMDCIKSGNPISFAINDTTADTTVWVGFVGPMSGG